MIQSKIQKRILTIGVLTVVGVFALVVIVSYIALQSRQLAELTRSGAALELLPIQNAGDSQWKPSLSGQAGNKTTLPNYQNIDETPCNGEVDFNIANAPGQTDAYWISLSSVPDNAIIKEITILPCASAASVLSSKASTMKVFYGYEGQNIVYSEPLTLPRTKKPTAMKEVSFRDLSITRVPSARGNMYGQMKIGVVYVGGNGARLSRLAARINYTAPPPPVPPVVPPTVATPTPTVATPTPTAP